MDRRIKVARRGGFTFKTIGQATFGTGRVNLIWQILVKGSWRSSSAISIHIYIYTYAYVYLVCDWHETGILFIYPSNWRQVSPHISLLSTLMCLRSQFLDAVVDIEITTDFRGRNMVIYANTLLFYYVGLACK